MQSMVIQTTLLFKSMGFKNNFFWKKYIMLTKRLHLFDQKTQ